MNEDIKEKLQHSETSIQKVDPKFSIIRSMLEQSKKKLIEVLPKSMSAEKMIRVALGTISKNPKIMECSPQSVMLSLLTAAEAGWDIGYSKEAYLVPLWNSKTRQMECQLWPGYIGRIKRMMNAGYVSIVDCRVVHERDTYEILLGTEDKIIHKPYLLGDPGAPVLVYGIAKMKDGTTKFDYMRWDEVLAIKSRAKARMKDASSPWDTDEEEMAKKTMVHRLAKLIPQSAEEKLIEDENGAITLANDDYEVIDGATGEIVTEKKEEVAATKRRGRPAGSVNKPKEDPVIETPAPEPPMFTDAELEESKKKIAEAQNFNLES